MFGEKGGDKKMNGWKTERHKEQVYNMYFRGQKDKKNKLWTETGKDRKTERTCFIG